MKLPPDRPVSLALSFALVRAATYLVPSAERGQFAYEWQQKLFHRWQFLRETGLWNSLEAFRLLVSGTPVILDAVQHFGAQESVRSNVSRFIQSPLTCLGLLSAVFLAIAIVNGGLPATTELFFKRTDSGPQKLVYVWSHNLRGGGDRPLPFDVIKAWKTHSQLITGAAAFRAVHREVQIKGAPPERRLIVITEPGFFDLMAAHPVTGKLTLHTNPYILLSYDAWVEHFHASPRIQGSSLTVAGLPYKILGVLPRGFRPLSRQSALYLVEPRFAEEDAFVALRTQAGISERSLDKELTDIAQNVTYYFLDGQIRYGFAQSEVLTPLRTFGFGTLAAVLMLFVVFRIKRRMLWPDASRRGAFWRRSAFFALKTSLALIAVFTACLEWSRSKSAILFGNFDPASGPFLLWLFILGTMGVLFWAVVDQKARCRECLQLLSFPVRMGTPGSLLLDWSGIELCCTQGHGVLHVPHLAPSWADESDHWIALDDSWQSVFGPEKHE